MDVLELRALCYDVTSDTTAHGVPVVVTRPAPDDIPIETTGIWFTPGLARPFLNGMPEGLDLQRRDRHRVIGLKVADVPTVPRGTRIEAVERFGDATTAWRVDGTEYADANHRRVVVVPETEP